MTYMELTYLHLGSLAPSIVIGGYLLLNQKGTPAHRLLGKIYMGLMLFTAIITLFMEALVGPKFLNHFGFLHLAKSYLFLVHGAHRLIELACRQHQVAHKRKMVWLYMWVLFCSGRLSHCHLGA